MIPLSHWSIGTHTNGSDLALLTMLKKAWQVSGASSGGGVGGGGVVGGATVDMAGEDVQLVLSKIIVLQGMISARPKNGSVTNI